MKALIYYGDAPHLKTIKIGKCYATQKRTTVKVQVCDDKTNIAISLFMSFSLNYVIHTSFFLKQLTESVASL